MLKTVNTQLYAEEREKLFTKAIEQCVKKWQSKKDKAASSTAEKDEAAADAVAKDPLESLMELIDRRAAAVSEKVHREHNNDDLDFSPDFENMDDIDEAAEKEEKEKDLQVLGKVLPSSSKNLATKNKTGPDKLANAAWIDNPKNSWKAWGWNNGGNDKDKNAKKGKGKGKIRVRGKTGNGGNSPTGKGRGGKASSAKGKGKGDKGGKSSAKAKGKGDKGGKASAKAKGKGKGKGDASGKSSAKAKGKGKGKGKGKSKGGSRIGWGKGGSFRENSWYGGKGSKNRWY